MAIGQPSVGDGAPLVMNPFTFKSLPYDPARDFTPVAMIAISPFVLAVHPGVAAKSINRQRR